MFHCQGPAAITHSSHPLFCRNIVLWSVICWLASRQMLSDHRKWIQSPPPRGYHHQSVEVRTLVTGSDGGYLGCSINLTFTQTRQEIDSGLIDFGTLQSDTF